MRSPVRSIKRCCAIWSVRNDCVAGDGGSVNTYELDQFCTRYGLDWAKLQTALNGLPPLSTEGPWLAGGALRRLLLGEDPLASDLDFFFRDAGQAREFQEQLRKSPGVEKVAGGEFAVTYSKPHARRSLKVQAITLRNYSSAADVCDSFDFTICQFATDGTTLTVGDYSLWDLARKRLTVHRISYASSSVRRLLKYASQGFTVCQGAAADLLKQVAADPTVIHSEVEYVD